MAEIRWTEESVKWLHNIYDYIAKDNPLAAQSVVDGIYAKAQLLKLFPQMGYKFRDEPDGEIRILLYGHYRIAYIVKYEVVEILGVFHGALDIEEHIKLS